MVEYRVICDIDRMDKSTGEIRTNLCTAPQWGGGIKHMHSYDKKRAEKWLKQAQEECPIYDEYTRISPSFEWLFIQSNFRLQTREVSEWKEEE